MYFDDQLQFAQPDLSADVGKMKQTGAQLIFTCIDQNESVILGKEMVKQHLNAVQQLPNAYDADVREDNAQYLQGDFVARSSWPSSTSRSCPRSKLLDEVDASRASLEVNELSTEGWIAGNDVRDRTEARRAQLLAAEAHRRPEPGHGLRCRRDDRADRLDDPAQRPARPGGTTIPKYAGKYDCSSTVRVQNGDVRADAQTPPGKPWVCMTGGPNAPTLTKTPVYMSFATHAPDDATAGRPRDPTDGVSRE